MENRCLQRAREAAGLTQEQLAEDVGTSVSKICRFDSGEREPRVAEIRRVAACLGVSTSLLIEGRETTIPVMGRIGTRAAIEPEFEQVAPEGIFEVETDLPLPERRISFEVVGDSGYPRYDQGDVIICPAEGEPRAIVSEAARRTPDGRRFLKKVYRVGGGFDLESHNAATNRGVQLQWPSPVFLAIRRAKWRKLSAQVSPAKTRARRAPRA